MKEPGKKSKTIAVPRTWCPTQKSTKMIRQAHRNHLTGTQNSKTFWNYDISTSKNKQLASLHIIIQERETTTNSKLICQSFQISLQ